MVSKRLKHPVLWSNPKKQQVRVYLEYGCVYPHGDRSAILGTPAQRRWETGKLPVENYQNGHDARTHSLEAQAEETTH